MHTLKIARGVQWVAIPEAGLFILCGCPADSVKLLMKKGLILPTESGGVTYETGPNAILLSDVPSQNETFSNLAEFPILQMLYRQGMILPGHPGNTGRKPLLIGIESQVRSQSQYIFRGNYGLSTVEEMTAAGIPEATAREYMRMKLWFAFGKIRETEELLESRIVGDDPVELRGGARVRRTGFNVYEFSCGSQSVSVDLNLGPGERYPSSYSLSFHRIRREYFSVVHNGEGDGWDPEKPCMGSIIIFQGRIYLIDAGPNIEQSLTALGISVNEIEGIFHSHSHDDHFAGLTSLVRSDHRIKYYATALVRASVAKKLSALMGMDEAMFPRYFEVHDLAAGEWNDVNGLQVRPVMSAHPVETNVFTFRVLWDGGLQDLHAPGGHHHLPSPGHDGGGGARRARDLRGIRAGAQGGGADAGRPEEDRRGRGAHPRGGLRFPRRQVGPPHHQPRGRGAQRRAEGDRLQRGVRPGRRPHPGERRLRRPVGVPLPQRVLRRCSRRTRCGCSPTARSSRSTPAPSSSRRETGTASCT